MITIQSHKDVLEIIIDSPPVNALGSTTRQELVRAIEQAAGDPLVKAILIRCKGKLFSAGADITEFGKEVSGPGLPEVVDRIESCDKPVVAAMHGTCFGGGLETALACHYRFAAPSAKLGLPEVKLGLLPGAGGTQRLPRLVGVQTALDMIVSGNPVSAQEAEECGLVDSVAGEETLLDDAIAFARRVSGVRRTGDRKVIAEPGVFEKFASENRRRIKGLDAPAACIEAIKAATEMPLAQGLAVERSLFTKLMDGEQSRALRHIFFAERAASKVEGLPKTTQLRPSSRPVLLAPARWAAASP